MALIFLEKKEKNVDATNVTNAGRPLICSLHTVNKGVHAKTPPVKDATISVPDKVPCC